MAEVSRSHSGLRRTLEILDRPPEPRWPARLLHHGARVLLLLATAVAVYLFFPAARLPDAAVLERGVVASEDVIAAVTFPVIKSESELARERADAASGIPVVLHQRPTAADTVLRGLQSFFASVDSLVTSSTEPEERRESVRHFLEQSRITPTPASIDLLLDPSRRLVLYGALESAIRELYPVGVLPATLADETFSSARIGTDADGERLVHRDSLLFPDRFFALAAERLPRGVGADATELQRLLLIRFFRPSLQYDQDQTAAARERAAAAVDPVKAVVLKGEKIVGAHEQVGEGEEERLRAYQAALPDQAFSAGLNSPARAVGAILFNVLVLSILGALFWLFRTPLYHDIRGVTLFALLIVAVTGAASLIARYELPPELIPVTFAALIVAVLWDGRLGLILALVLALLIGAQAPFLGLSAPFAIALGGAAAAFSVRIAQRRSKRWLFILLISAAYAAAALALGLLQSRTGVEVRWSILWGVINAVVASLLAIGFLPLLESFTRITTDETLLELSDLNRNALLKRLAFEASGTHHHTINVANLAEAACHAVGGNGLLTRVGAYYHDIGKLVKPQFFIENQPKGRNPHDKLKPGTSASIIRSHVTEGLKLAEQHRLPSAVRDFIAEHHGTQQISFFYQRARELDPEGQINPAEFAYPGPKPQSKETAILMLSDSVESAARVLTDPNPGRIRDLVERITAGKLTTGQLTESPLTLRDIEAIKEQLVKVLTGMYHHRIDYPTSATIPPDPMSPQETAAVDVAAAGG